MGWFLIARFTLQEVVRKKLFLAIVIITVLLVGVFALLLNALIGAALSGSSNGAFGTQLIYTGIGITISVLSVWAIYLMSSTLTILLTIAMISGEIEGGTFAVIVPKPLHRAEIIFGKWLAYAVLLSMYNAILFVAFLGLIYWQTGYLPEQILPAFGMIELCIFSLLGLTTFFGAQVSTLVNGAICILLFIGAPIASIVQFAFPTQSHTIQNIATVVNLVMPTDALWHNASFYLLPPIVLDLIHASQSQVSNLPVIGAQQMPPALLVWVFMYAVALPILGALRFQYRDL